MSGKGLKEGLEWFIKFQDAADKSGEYLTDPVKETLEDGKAVLKSGQSWLSSFLTGQTVNTYA